MPSTLSIAEIAQTAQVTRADVIRVIRGGGTTQADWHIAQTIEQLGGRRAADLMWGPERIPTETPLATNPDAVHTDTVTIYAEDANGLVTDTDEQTDADSRFAADAEATDAAEAAELAEGVWIHLVRYARSYRTANRITQRVAAAGSLVRARMALYRELATNPTTSLFGFLHPAPALAA